MKKKHVDVYTDGSCDPGSRIGGWAALILADGDKVELSGKAYHTTHQRMELTAAIEAIRYIESSGMQDRQIFLFTDSQYLAGLSGRKTGLLARGLKTMRNHPVPNTDLLLLLFFFLETFSLLPVKVAAHEKANGSLNLNLEVDRSCRKVMRDAVRKKLG